MGLANRLRFAALFAFVFLIVYYPIGYLPRESAMDASIRLDALIPLVPSFLIFYVLGDLYLFLAFFLVQEGRLARLTKGTIRILLIAAVCFLLLPVRVPDAPDAPGVSGTLVALYHRLDPRYNALPSLHAAFTVFAWFALYEERRNVALWSLPVVLLIVASTVLVKQHVIIDMLAGIALGYIMYRWWRIIPAPARRGAARQPVVVRDSS